jgi:acyl carrier protein
MSDVTATLVDLVQRVTETPDVTETTKFEGLPNWVSLSALRLLADIEDEFEVRLDLRTYFAVTDVGELSTLVTTALTRVSNTPNPRVRPSGPASSTNAARTIC